MEFTGKNKEQFESYYIQLIRKERKDYDKFSDEVVLRKFYRSLLSMQWGILQDYADSIGYDVYTHNSGRGYMWTIYPENTDGIYDGEEATRDEARLAAIKAFDEIVNGN